jgi:mannose-6-phosphate isomerase-like protein (cupin superfamily)
MKQNLYVARGEGRRFTFRADTITIQACGDDTVDGRSIMHWISGIDGLAPNHVHDRYEETFYIIDGVLEFTLGDELMVVRSGDFIRVPPGTRHGFRNKSGRPVPMIVTLAPGGFEEFFYAYRAEPGGKTMDGAIDEARTKYGTVYEQPAGG